MACELLLPGRDSNPIHNSENRRTDGGSRVLITAGPIRQRSATAGAPRGDYLRLAPGVPTLTPPPLMPTFVQDDERFR
jgi:hypothetical protein